MIHILDTSALKWGYLTRSRHHRRLRYIITRLRGSVFIAEISMLEIVSALGSEFRGGAISAAEYALGNMSFLRDVAAGKVVVVPFRSADYIPCRDLLTLVGVRRGRSIQSQDGMVLYTARSLAIERRQAVKLLTSDRGMTGVASTTDIFQRVIKCEFLPRG